MKFGRLLALSLCVSLGTLGSDLPEALAATKRVVPKFSKPFVPPQGVFTVGNISCAYDPKLKKYFPGVGGTKFSEYAYLVDRDTKKLSSTKGKKLAALKKTLAAEKKLAKSVACKNGPSGGGGGGGGGTPDCESVAAYTGPVDSSYLGYILTKAGLGVSDKEAPVIASGVQNGLHSFVTALTTYVPDPAGLDEAVAGKFANNQYVQGVFYRMLKTNNPVIERTVEALLSTLTLSTNQLPADGRYMFGDYYNILRNAAKNNTPIVDLLKTISSSPAMLYYLDGRLNQAAGPNENYGRELMELFSLGVNAPDGTPNYSEARPTGDVYKNAFVLTGYTLVKDSNGKYQTNFVNQFHDSTPFTLFDGTSHSCTVNAVSGDQAMNNLIDCISHHPNFGGRFATQFLRAFLTDEPSVKLRQNTIAMIQSKKNVMDIVGAILESQAMHCVANYQHTTTIKPDAYAAKIARILKMAPAIEASLDNNLGKMETAIKATTYDVSNSPTVFYVKDEVFQTSSAVLAYINMVGSLLDIGFKAGKQLFDYSVLFPARAGATSDEAVAKLVQITGLPLSGARATAFQNFFDTNYDQQGNPVREVWSNTDTQQSGRGAGSYIAALAQPDLVAP